MTNIHNNLLRSFAVFLLLFVCNSAFADKIVRKITKNNAMFKSKKTVDMRHYGWASIEGGYHLLQEDFDDLNTLGGSAVHFGTGYEFQLHGIYTSIGVDFNLWTSSATTQPYNFDQRMYDTQGKLMTYHFKISESIERSSGVIAAFPIMIGYSFQGIHIGGGVSFGYNLSAKSRVKREYVTSATYPQYIEDFTNMPNHFYTNYESTNTEKLAMKTPINILGEIGYNVLRSNKYQKYQNMQSTILKVGAFIEYGLCNVFKNELDGALVEPNPEHPTQLNLHPYYNNKSTTEHNIFPISAGIKVTYMMRIPTKNCNCY